MQIQMETKEEKVTDAPQSTKPTKIVCKEEKQILEDIKNRTRRLNQLDEEMATTVDQLRLASRQANIANFLALPAATRTFFQRKRAGRGQDRTGQNGQASGTRELVPVWNSPQHC